MSNTVPTPIVDRNGKRTTVHKRAVETTKVSEHAIVPTSAVVDNDKPNDPSITPYPASSFQKQDVERTTISGNPAVRITFPDAPDRQVLLIADPGNGTYFRPQIMTIVQDGSGESLILDEYEFGGQDHYGSDPIIQDDSGTLRKYSNFGQDTYVAAAFVPISTLDTIPSRGSVGGEYLSERGLDPLWVDSEGGEVMNTVLPNLHSDAIDFLIEHAPSANPPEFPDPYTPTISFVDSPRDYLRGLGR